MALIDVAFLLEDVDFTDVVTLIKRTQTINSFGEMVLVETPQDIIAVVQEPGSNPDILLRFKDSANLAGGIFVYYKGALQVENGPDTYCDVIFWRGSRYLVKAIDETYLNYGQGFTKALCLLEVPNG